LIWECLSQLLNNPSAGRMLCHIEMQEAPTIVTDDEKTVAHAERDGRDGEEVHRGDCFSMVAQETEPALGGL
jgi:hypothetical protein